MKPMEIRVVTENGLQVFTVETLDDFELVKEYVDFYFNRIQRVKIANEFLKKKGLKNIHIS